MLQKRFLESFSCLQVVETFFADELALVKLRVFSAAAENARRLVFFQYDGIFVYEDFNGILAGKRKILSDFDGKNDSSEVIDASDDSCGFHVWDPP